MAGVPKPEPIPHVRLTPPRTLSKPAATLFRTIVGTADRHHFAPCDVPLLVEYVKAVELAETASAELAQGPVIEGKVSPWVIVQEKAQRAMVALSARLRICPQSRFDRLVAGTAARRRAADPHDFAGTSLAEFPPPMRPS